MRGGKELADMMERRKVGLLSMYVRRLDLMTSTASTSGQCHSFTGKPFTDLTAEADVGVPLPLISTPSRCRKRLRLSSTGGSDTLDSITAYMLANEKTVGAGAPVGAGGPIGAGAPVGAGAPISECDVFGQHLAND